MNAIEPEKHVRKTALTLGRVAGAVCAIAIGCCLFYKTMVVIAPKVGPKTGDKAVKELESEGFFVVTLVGKEETPKEDVKSSIVSAQEPTPTTTIRGAVVTLIFKEPEPKVVPYVVDKTEDDARKVLEEAGFEVVTDISRSEDIKKGTVISQEPGVDPKIKYPPGKEVTITVSAGAERLTVPNVIGLAVDEAKTRLEAAGFNARPEMEEPPVGSEVTTRGAVFKQVPGPRVSAAPGSTVVIKFVTVLVSVPLVSGKSERDAVKTLEEAGFKVKVKKVISNRVTVGKIITQTPSGLVAAGTPVTIVVSSPRVPPPSEVLVMPPPSEMLVRPSSEVPVTPEEIYYCKYCNLEIPSGVQKCPRCGTAVR